METSFDRLTRLAARVLNSSAALISYSEGGVDLQIREPRDDHPEAAVAQSMCQRVIDSAQTVAIDDARGMVERKRHDLVVSLGEELLPLDVDPARVEQILVNLLNNAAKYTDEGGRIVLKAERAGKDVNITVSDTGMGISAEMLPHVFDLFSQVPHAMDRSQGGLGIGLTLVRKLTEMHGGKAEAVSEGPGKGSEFSVALPLWEEMTVKKAEPKKAVANDVPTGLRILVVDDNVDSAVSMAMVLKISGHEVRMAYDGDAAVDVAFEQCPDAILLDIGLPGRDGYAVAEILRRDDRCKDTFIVALSGYGQDEDRRRSGEAGFDAHLVKPVDVDELLKMLANPQRTHKAAAGPD